MSRRIKNKAAIIFSFVLGSVFAESAAAAMDRKETSALCDLALVSAARTENVPEKILKAIARTESGRSVGGELRPWPWALNVEGKGLWLVSKEEAISIAKHTFEGGIENFDVGCFQINYKWHGRHFDSIERMLDPFANAHYAAKFLKKLHSEIGSWTGAIGAYHSRNQQFAKPYLARFQSILSEMGGSQKDTSEASVRTNTFPLLRGRAASKNRGSLFPDSKQTSKNFFAPLGVRG